MEQREKLRFTPGVWQASATVHTIATGIGSAHFTLYDQNEKKCIASCELTAGNQEAINEITANFLLMRAAPEMYEWEEETLEVLRQICRMTGVPYSLWQRLEDLIAEGEKNGRKARGEE